MPAIHALDAVLACQFDEPDKVYHGTFFRAPEEACPPEPAVEWRYYDPNWREFIITTIAIILSRFAITRVRVNPSRAPSSPGPSRLLGES